MIELAAGFERVALYFVWAALLIAGSMLLAVVVQRVALWTHQVWLRRGTAQYEPLVRRALDGDEAALYALINSPASYRLTIARLLILPLIHDRDLTRIAATRAIVRAMSLVATADKFLRSRWWWRRALALRALGLVQAEERTAQIVAALDDPNVHVRGAALDALADMHNRAALPAIVVRLHDASLQRERRAAALAAFGSDGESFLLELAEVDPDHRLNYARALAICGTERSRSTLCEWTSDTRQDVRAGAFEALAHVGLDERAADLAIKALDSHSIPVRAMAAAALRGWTGPGEAAFHLARHLDDSWTVAVQAARSLQAMPDAGLVALEARALTPDLAGKLARQMLWEVAVVQS